MKTSLVIMAAGIGSRFGKNKIKQLEPVGEHGEILLEYSVYDAAEARFDRIIFVIRRDLENKFAPLCKSYSEKYKIEVRYVFQEIDDIPVKVNVLREKPWGTGHALLAARALLDTPYAVINSDDYYGRDAFAKLHDFICSPPTAEGKLSLCMMGYLIKNSISDKGTVTRAVCKTENSILSEITETYNVRRENGVIMGNPMGGELAEIPEDALVSMNMWGFPAEMTGVFTEMFTDFLNTSASDPKSEFIIPNVVKELLRQGSAEVTVLRSDEESFGMTREEDMADVKLRIKELEDMGRYDKMN